MDVWHQPIAKQVCDIAFRKGVLAEMKIGIIQATSQKDKNRIMEDCLYQAVSKQNHEIVNFGIYPDSDENMSYVQIALCSSLLLESQAVDFIITGCSSGQGMMLACNSLPGVICGYVENVTDAYLFGRINNGNAVSYPLGFQWGWAAEINLKETLKALFRSPFGIGYPTESAGRKIQNTKQMQAINRLCKKELIEILPMIEDEILKPVLQYDVVYQYLMTYGKDMKLKEFLKVLRR